MGRKVSVSFSLTKSLHPNAVGSREKAILLTIEFFIHPPPYIYPAPEPVRLVTHRNNTTVPLLDLVTQLIKDRSQPQKPKPLPDWCLTLVPTAEEGNDDNNDINNILFLLPLYPPRPPNNPLHSLDSKLPTHLALRHKAFLEWPIIEVRMASSFKGRLVGEENSPVDRGEEPPTAKRRKVDIDVGGLLGGYASGDEDDEDEAVTMKEDVQEEAGVLAHLGYDSETSEALIDGEIDDGDVEDDETLDRIAIDEVELTGPNKEGRLIEQAITPES